MWYNIIINSIDYTRTGVKITPVWGTEVNVTLNGYGYETYRNCQYKPD